MRLLLTILVAVLAALGARRLALARGMEGTPVPDATGRAELLAGIAEVRAENQRLARELERRSVALATPATPADDEPGEAEIGAALARWRAANPEAERAAAQEQRVAARGAPGALDISSTPMDELVRVLASEGLTDLDRQVLFQELRDQGRIDEYVAAIEALAAADPENAELQISLGNAYLQQLFGMGQSPEVGTVAMKSDRAFDRALEIDETNWEARFTKAVSLSNWPAFMGRGPEAIEHFEILLEQQEGQPPRPEYAMTYLFLGNMHQASGDRAEAIATWKAGLALFPEVEDLRRALELAQGQ